MRRRGNDDSAGKRWPGWYKTFWLMLLFLFCIAGAYKYFEAQARQNEDAFNLNLSTEILGVVASTGVTLFFLNNLNERRDRNNLKQRLIREVGSGSNDFTLNAVSWLRAEGWLSGEDGVLQGQDLRGANLSGAALYFHDSKGERSEAANLEAADLMNSEFVGAQMDYVNLKDAQLGATNLFRAHLNYADLTGAYLGGSNLECARMYGATLHGAMLSGVQLNRIKLSGAKLQGAVLFGAKNLDKAVLDGAIMPDGEPYDDGMRLTKFTHLNDEEFSDTYAKVNMKREEIGLSRFQVVIGGDTFIPPH